MTTRDDYGHAFPKCGLCYGSGWQECTDNRRHAHYCLTKTALEHEACQCHAVTPCKCSIGTARLETHDRILRANRENSTL
jgi:hypothetical protein